MYTVSFWHIYHFRLISILNLCALPTWRVAEYAARWTKAICGGTLKISFLLERWLCQSFMHLTRPSWPIFQATSMSGHCSSWSVVLEKISAAHLKGEPGLLLGWSPVSQKVPKILTRQCILQFEQCCSHSVILTSLALACTGIVMRDSRNNVNLFWQPGSGIIQKKSCLLQSHMAHAWCVIFLKVQQWTIQLSTTCVTGVVNPNNQYSIY